MRNAIAITVLLLASCKEMIVPSPSRATSAPDPPPTPLHVEAAMIAGCSPTSHFGTKEASDMLKFPMRWDDPNKGSIVCAMVPPLDTRPYFWISVVDHADFDAVARLDGAELDRDAVAGATRVAWFPKRFILVVSDASRLVTVE